MKKTAAVLAVTFAICLLLGFGVFASRSDFVIEGGTLTGYYGTGGDVIIPEDVTSISPGVFSFGSVSSVTVLNPNCAISAGAIASGVPIRGYSGSTAQSYAFDVLSEFSPITEKPTVTLRISYLFQDGTAASDQYVRNLYVYSAYDVPSPAVGGYTPDLARVQGSVEDGDVAIVVTYSKNPDLTPTGWKIEGNHIRFYDSSAGGYINSGTISIDGVERSFDGNGYLIGSGSTVTVNGATYYLINNVICYGSVRIDDGIYYFDADGKMVKGQTVDGNTYDAEGRLTLPGQLLVLDGSTYYLDGNSLFSGYLLSGDDIYCFGDDYAMKAGVTSDDCTFETDGRLSSVNADVLECTYDETRTYNKQEQKPPVEVFLKGIKLTENVHYTVEYADNVGPGEGKIIITGKGFVKGSAEHTFEIVGKETFTLTVRYQNTRGYEMHEPYTAELNGGEHYSVTSPEIKGYKPDKQKVEGDMASADVTVVVTYTSEKEGETETAPVGDETAETGETGPETEENDKGPEEQKTRLVYKYNFKLFFTVAAIATLIVAIIIFLLVRFGKKRRNPPASPGGDGPDDGDLDGPVGPAAFGAAGYEEDENAEEIDKSDTLKFDLTEIELDDFEEAKPASDFVDLYEFSLGDAPEKPAVPGIPKRYHFRKK